VRTVSANGISINVHDEGQGTPILFVHGFPLDHQMWREQFPLASDFRVIAPDLRGFGRTTVTEGTVTMETHADDLAALLDELALSEKIVLCGLSMSGYVAWQFQRKYGDRLRGADSLRHASDCGLARGRREPPQAGRDRPGTRHRACRRRDDAQPVR